MRRAGDIIFFGSACFLAGLLLGLKRPETAPQDAFPARVDTLTVHDTIRAVEPVSVAVERVRVDTVRLVSVERDTVAAEVPFERKVYGQDSLYRAVVTGYRASLDTLELWPRNVYVTRTVTERTGTPRFSVGVQAGVGAVFPAGGVPGVGPYLGVGVGWRF